SLLFQAEDGIRVFHVTGVQTCALPILSPAEQARLKAAAEKLRTAAAEHQAWLDGTLVPQAKGDFRLGAKLYDEKLAFALMSPLEIGSAPCRGCGTLAAVGAPCVVRIAK